MKILFVTFEAPSNFSGGGIVVKQSILSLAKNYSVDYIGPEIVDEECKNIIDERIFLNYSNNKIVRIIDLIRGFSTGYFRSWNKKIKEIDLNKYEVVHLEFSRYDFVSKYVKKFGKKLSVRVHNVEYDYYNNLYKSEKSIRLFIRKNIISKQEKTTLREADMVICLTEKDKQRLINLYPLEIKNDKITVIPVCIQDEKNITIENQNFEVNYEMSPYILATGSLWYGPNVEGILWFVNNVWKYICESENIINKNIKLVIAGSRPNENLRGVIQNYNNIELIENPKDMGTLFKSASFYIAPIFNGAGMKVKVAEALSYGLPIIGTEHTFIGYDIVDKKNGFYANDEYEFMNVINLILSLDTVKIRSFRNDAYELFSNNYSIISSVAKFQRELEFLINEK